MTTVNTANLIDQTALIIDIISGCDGFEMHNASAEDLWSHTWSPIQAEAETKGQPIVTLGSAKWLGIKKVA